MITKENYNEKVAEYINIFSDIEKSQHNDFCDLITLCTESPELLQEKIISDRIDNWLHYVNEKISQNVPKTPYLEVFAKLKLNDAEIEIATLLIAQRVDEKPIITKNIQSLANSKGIYHNDFYALKRKLESERVIPKIWYQKIIKTGGRPKK
jgi:hypothetical protein